MTPTRNIQWKNTYLMQAIQEAVRPLVPKITNSVSRMQDDRTAATGFFMISLFKFIKKSNRPAKNAANQSEIVGVARSQTRITASN